MSAHVQGLNKTFVTQRLLEKIILTGWLKIQKKDYIRLHNQHMLKVLHFTNIPKQPDLISLII